MKTLIFIAVFVIPALGFTLSSAEKTEFKVYGACGMCKARIEKAATSVDGVSSAQWSQKTQMLSLTWDEQKANVEEVHEKIAGSGHDTEKVAAEDETYSSLPACCHYERAADDKPGHESNESHESHGSHGCCKK